MRGNGSVFRRDGSPNWYVSYYVNGKRNKESSGSTRKSDATALLRRRLAELSSGKFVGPHEDRLTYDDLERGILDDYQVNGRKSARRLRTSLRHLRSFFGHY